MFKNHLPSEKYFEGFVMLLVKMAGMFIKVLNYYIVKKKRYKYLTKPIKRKTYVSTFLCIFVSLFCCLIRLICVVFCYSFLIPVGIGFSESGQGHFQVEGKVEIKH